MCSRVGIMAGGRLRALGSVQRLKQRHGQGCAGRARGLLSVLGWVDLGAVMGWLWVRYWSAGSTPDCCGLQRAVVGLPFLGRGQLTIARSILTPHTAQVLT